MGTLKLNNVTAITESGGTVTVDSAVAGIPAAGITGTIASGVTIPAAGVTGTLPNAVQDNITRLGTVTAGTLGAGSILNGTRLTDLKSTDGGESAITCDANGYVTLPQQPSVFVQHSTGGAITDPNGVIPFNTIKFQNGISYSTSTYKATVPVTGLYYWRAYTITQDAAQHAMILYVNGTQIAYTHAYGHGSWNRISIDGIAEMSASETAWPHLDLTGSAGWHGGAYSGFYGYLIG